LLESCRAIGNGFAELVREIEDGSARARVHLRRRCKRVVVCLLIMAPHLPFWSMLPSRKFGQKVSPTTPAPEPQNVSKRRKVTRYGGEFFSDHPSSSTESKAACAIYF
jgi:hypothetical protein